MRGSLQIGRLEVAFATSLDLEAGLAAVAGPWLRPSRNPSMVVQLRLDAAAGDRRGPLTFRGDRLAGAVAGGGVLGDLRFGRIAALGLVDASALGAAIDAALRFAAPRAGQLLLEAALDLGGRRPVVRLRPGPLVALWAEADGWWASVEPASSRSPERRRPLGPAALVDGQGVEGAIAALSGDRFGTALALALAGHLRATSRQLVEEEPPQPR